MKSRPLLDDRLVSRRRLGEPVTERDAVIVRAQHDVEPRAAGVGERQRPLSSGHDVVAPFAERQRVTLVDRSRLGRADESEPRAEVLVGAPDAERRVRQDGLSVARDTPCQGAVRLPRDGDRVVTVGRGERPGFLCECGDRREQKKAKRRERFHAG
ncbi:MAG: hypothetical protein DMF86_15700 [Acidobacteria bacterium]|nr:MAG: hypothetical protein DMF86_15700 [Acidobacteriota bacterium]